MRSRLPSVWVERKKSTTGVWTYRVRSEKDGQRLPDIVCGPNKEHALRVRDRERDLLWGNRLNIQGSGEDLRFVAFMNRDLARRETRQAPETVRNDRRAMSMFFDYFGDGPVRGIDRPVIAGFEAWLRQQTWRRRDGGKERPYHVNGIRIVLRALKAALRRGFKDGHLDRDPFFGYDLPPEEPVANPPTREAARALWKALPFLGRCAVAVELGLGLRRGELARLSQESLTPPERGRAHWLMTVQKSKTRRGRMETKTMAVPEVAMKALLAMRPWPADGRPIFNVHRTYLSQMISRAARKAGLGRVRLHDLRHRWATELMAACRDEYALMQVGGWTSRAAVARYQHTTPQRRDVTLKISGPLPPLLPPNAGGKELRKRRSSTEMGR